EGETAVEFGWWTVLGTMVTVTGGLGLVLRGNRLGAAGVFGFAAVLYLLAVHAATFALPRFAVPIWPVLVLASAAWVARPKPGRIAAGAWIVCSLGIVLFLVSAYRRRPACEVSAERMQYFDITAARHCDARDGGACEIRASGERPK